MRRSGQTTRLIDRAIQSLFNNGELYLLKKQSLSKSNYILKKGEALFVDIDHKMSNQAQQDFIYRVMRRLEIEHSNAVEFTITGKDYIHIKRK